MSSVDDLALSWILCGAVFHLNGDLKMQDRKIHNPGCEVSHSWDVANCDYTVRFICPNLASDEDMAYTKPENTGVILPAFSPTGATWGTSYWRQKSEVSPDEDLSWEVETSINNMLFGCDIVLLLSFWLYVIISLYCFYCFIVSSYYTLILGLLVLLCFSYFYMYCHICVCHVSINITYLLAYIFCFQPDETVHWITFMPLLALMTGCILQSPVKSVQNISFS